MKKELMSNFIPDHLEITILPHKISAHKLLGELIHEIDVEIYQQNELKNCFPMFWEQLCGKLNDTPEHFSFKMGMGERNRIDSTGIVKVLKDVVSEVDVYRSMDAAKQIEPDPQKWVLVQSTLKGFTLDDVSIEHPVGLKGKRLEAHLSNTLLETNYLNILKDFCASRKLNYLGAGI